MRETLEQLIALQRMDLDLNALRTRIDDLHKGLHGAQADLEKAKAVVEAAHGVLQHSQAALHSHETDLQASEDRVKRFQVKLNTASTNKEFAAIQLEIGTKQAENGKLEELILLAMDDVEEKERTEDAARGLQKDAEAALRAAESRLEGQRQGLEADFETQQAARSELAGAIIPAKLTLYDRIRSGNLSSGTAVVAVHGEYCQGCQMAVRPQDISDLHAGTEVILCRNCHRILVLEL